MEELFYLLQREVDNVICLVELKKSLSGQQLALCEKAITSSTENVEAIALMVDTVTHAQRNPLLDSPPRQKP